MVFARAVTAAITAALLAGTAAGAEDLATVARAFGTRSQIRQISLSPDGQKVAIITPLTGAASALMIADPIAGGQPSYIIKSDGNPERMWRCGWITTKRLACQFLFFMQFDGVRTTKSRLAALDLDGGNVKELSITDSRLLNGGNIIDWTGGNDAAVMMTRDFGGVEGLGVEQVNSLTGFRTRVETPKRDATNYITDGRGQVRIMEAQSVTNYGYADTKVRYMYRLRDASNWRPLSFVRNGEPIPSGFLPVAVDPERNVAYGFAGNHGFKALFSAALDGSGALQPVLSRPDTDVDGLITIGRQHRVVGVSYATEKREVEYFDPGLRALSASLGKALPNAPIFNIIDASADEKKLLLFAGSDTNPGIYYLLDRTTNQMVEVLPARPLLAGRTLAAMKPISFPAADGTRIPAYLTLPPGSSGKNIPAIVMPHGGPGARDEWGFHWLVQFFAARGFAVLQPNFRGSTGYGEPWFQKNGFQSWRTAIGDVVDAGRWLKTQGIAAPSKIAIFGWGYGGYAALQSQVLDPDLYKAVIAVAPVTDLVMLKADAHLFVDSPETTKFIGEGPHVTQGSPARNVAGFEAPVLIFHGAEDRNFDIAQSQVMTARLRGAGKQADLVIFKGLDHQLEDTEARTMMLTRSDEFLRKNLGIAP